MQLLTVNVNASEKYTVSIGAGLLGRTGEMLLKLKSPCTAAVVTDGTVKELYLSKVLNSLENAGYNAISFSFAPGEGSKNISTLSDILEFLAENRVTRSDVLVALGGGVVGDITGFAAGCYLRGVPFVQLPTTLLAAVDSSVGGKTAVDLKAGKNLAGLFLQPLAVFCDTDTLSTLPADTLSDGAAEAVKYGVLCDRPLFDMFKSGAPSDMNTVIKRCVEIKADIVEKDEFDTGIRQSLNLGHTIGHAIEKCSGYTVPHGHAVAAGTAMIAKAAAKMGYCSEKCASKIAFTLEKNGLPVSCPYTAEELAEACLSDKKRQGGTITLVLPEDIGRCVLKKIPVGELGKFIAAAVR